MDRKKKAGSNDYVYTFYTELVERRNLGSSDDVYTSAAGWIERRNSGFSDDVYICCCMDRKKKVRIL